MRQISADRSVVSLRSHRNEEQPDVRRVGEPMIVDVELLYPVPTQPEFLGELVAVHVLKEVENVEWRTLRILLIALLQILPVDDVRDVKAADVPVELSGDAVVIAFVETFGVALDGKGIAVIHGPEAIG